MIPRPEVNAQSCWCLLSGRESSRSMGGTTHQIDTQSLVPSARVRPFDQPRVETPPTKGVRKITSKEGTTVRRHLGQQSRWELDLDGTRRQILCGQVLVIDDRVQRGTDGQVCNVLVPIGIGVVAVTSKVLAVYWRSLTRGCRRVVVDEVKSNVA